MTEEPAAAPRPRVSGYAWYALILFVIVYIFNFIDRQIVSILAESIKADLKLDDAQIGFLYGTAFAVFYALFGIPLGRLADSWYRGRLMAIGLALWSSMTALSGFAQNFGMLAAARIGVGIGEASASPAAYSMIADYFPKERRATALSIYSSGLYIGGGIALPVGGFVLAEWGAAVPGCGNCPARPCAMAGRLPRGGTSRPAARSLDLEPEGAAARRDRRPPVRHRPSQRLARFRTRACRDPSAADAAERRANSRRDAAQSARSRRQRCGRLPARHADRRLAAVDRLVDRHLRGLQLDPVAQAPRSSDAQADLGNADRHDAGHRLRQHQLRDLCGRILDPALRAPDVLHRAQPTPR